MKQAILPSMLVLLAALNGVTASPTGAMLCPADIPAVGGSHLLESSTITTGTLDEGGFQLSLAYLGEAVILTSDVANEFTAGQDYTLTLTATSDEKPIRGFLIRLGSSAETAVDTIDALMPVEADANAQIAETVCVANENVGGVTHIDNLDKSSVSVTLNLDTPANNLPMDVTVVVRNRDGVSEYYFQHYSVTAVAGEGGSVTTSDGEAATTTDATAESTSSSSPGAKMVLGMILAVGSAVATLL